MIAYKEHPNNKVIFLKMAKIPNAVRLGAKKAMQEIGVSLETTAKRSITDSPARTGKTYRYKGKAYTASRRGEVPANVSGKNLKGIKSRVLSRRALAFGNTVNYSKFLEQDEYLGRNYLLRAIKRNRAKIRSILKKNIDRKIKNA